MNVLEVLQGMAKFVHEADAAAEAVRGTPAAAAAVRKDNRLGWLEHYDKLLESADRTVGSAASVRALTAFIAGCDSFEGDDYQKATGYRPANMRPLGEAIRDYDDRPQLPKACLESIAHLRKIGVGPSQICKIWRLDVEQLRQETENPGCVIGTAAFIRYATDVLGYSPDLIQYTWGVSEPVDSGWTPPWEESHQRALATEKEVFDAAMVQLREVLATARKHRQQVLSHENHQQGAEDHMARFAKRPMPPSIESVRVEAMREKREARDKFIDNAHR